jgi:hypothetical protein
MLVLLHARASVASECESESVYRRTSRSGTMPSRPRIPRPWPTCTLPLASPFLPTASPEHIKSGDNTEDYFKAFVLKNLFGTITDDNVQVYEDGMATCTQACTPFEPGEGADRKPVKARFSYMWNKCKSTEPGRLRCPNGSLQAPGPHEL